MRSLKLTVNAEGALRSVTAGDIICQDKVDKWKNDNGTCRFCKAAVETPRHRLWDCERWAQVRIKAVMGLGIEVVELRDDLPILAKLSGILPKDPELVEARLKAERAPERTGRKDFLSGDVYTDGSAIYPESPWLRRASWSIAWRFAVGEWVWVNGKTNSGQSG
eukprot:15208019-Heterocapsa_arctica.AAC.1